MNMNSRSTKTIIAYVMKLHDTLSVTWKVEKMKQGTSHRPENKMTSER